MTRTKEKGVALILTMILLGVLTVMSVSLMFLSQSETWSTMNYRLMSQARDAAEAGVNAAVNHLLYTYTPPATGSPTDPIGVYTLTTLPVSVGGVPVVLSANSDMAASYPVASVQDEFDAASEGYLTAGNAQVNYTAYAELLSMREIIAYGQTTPTTIQTWRITADGTIAGVQNANVEVSAVLDRPITAVFAYAAFGESPTCGSMTWGGTNSFTGSYDSSTVTPPTPPTTDLYGGNIGTNGNLTEGGGATVNGSLSTPRSGVGNCNNGNVNALDINGGASVTGGLVELPQPIDYPTPDPPTPTPPTTNRNLTNNASCTGLAGCSIVVGGSEYRLAPTCADTDGYCAAGAAPLYGNISVGAGKTLHLTAGTYNFNSISLGGNARVVIDSGPVILNIAGAGIANNQYAADFGGGSITNTTYDPTNFQIMYGGTAGVRLTGGSANSGLVYAPNSNIIFTGGGDWYGAVIGATVNNQGGANLIYDRRLQRELYNIGNYMLQAFTWKKF